MKGFINDHFLLQNETAQKLYHDYAETLPIIDFHNHLIPKDIAEDRIFGNIGSLWLEGDHYKWRAMRACGVPEKYITGEADDWEKFEKWAHTVPKIIRNPLYHWTHLELKRYFEIDELLNPSTAREIYDQCNRQAEKPGFSVRNLLRKMNVEYLCSMEDPADPLIWHKEIKKDFEIEVSAAFRPDKILDILNPARFKKYLKQLEEASDTEISDYYQLCHVLEDRHNYFHDFGCRQGTLRWIGLYLRKRLMKKPTIFLERPGRGSRFPRRKGMPSGRLFYPTYAD